MTGKQALVRYVVVIGRTDRFVRYDLLFLLLTLARRSLIFAGHRHILSIVHCETLFCPLTQFYASPLSLSPLHHLRQPTSILSFAIHTEIETCVPLLHKSLVVCNDETLFHPRCLHLIHLLRHGYPTLTRNIDDRYYDYISTARGIYSRRGHQTNHMVFRQVSLSFEP